MKSVRGPMRDSASVSSSKHAALVDVLGLIDVATGGEQLRGGAAGEVDTQAQIVQRRLGVGGLSVLPGEQRGTVEQHSHLGHQLIGLASSDVSGGGHRKRSFRRRLLQGFINPPARGRAPTGRAGLWITPGLSVLGRKLVTDEQDADRPSADHAARS